MRVPATATDRKIAPFEPALEELAISPEPRTSQLKPGDFERVPAAMTNHRIGQVPTNSSLWKTPPLRGAATR